MGQEPQVDVSNLWTGPRIFVPHWSEENVIKLLDLMRKDEVKPNSSCYRTILHSNLAVENCMSLLGAAMSMLRLVRGITPIWPQFTHPDPGLSYSEEHHQRCYDLYIEMRENGSLEKGLVTPQYMSADGQIGSLVNNCPSRRGADLKLDSIIPVVIYIIDSLTMILF